MIASSLLFLLGLASAETLDFYVAPDQSSLDRTRDAKH